MNRKTKSLNSKYDFDAWIKAGAGLNDKRMGWAEGEVDQSEPFFLAVANSTPAALIGQNPTQFVVQWLNDDESVQEQAREKLDFFLTNEGTEVMQRMGRWRYMIHSAVATSSNFYSRVQLRFIEPPRTLDEVLQSSSTPRSAASREVVSAVVREVSREGVHTVTSSPPKRRATKTGANPSSPSLPNLAPLTDALPPTGFSGHTPQEGARADDVRGVESPLSWGDDVNALDRNGLAALHHAVARNQMEIARALLEAGADVNALSIEQVRGIPSVVGRTKCETPWHKAKTPKMKNLLAEHGAATNIEPFNPASAQLTALQKKVLRKAERRMST